MCFNGVFHLFVHVASISHTFSVAAPTVPLCCARATRLRFRSANHSRMRSDLPSPNSVLDVTVTYKLYTVYLIGCPIKSHVTNNHPWTRQLGQWSDIFNMDSIPPEPRRHQLEKPRKDGCLVNCWLLPKMQKTARAGMDSWFRAAWKQQLCKAWKDMEGHKPWT